MRERKVVGRGHCLRKLAFNKTINKLIKIGDVTIMISIDRITFLIN